MLDIRTGELDGPYLPYRMDAPPTKCYGFRTRHSTKKGRP